MSPRRSRLLPALVCALAVTGPLAACSSQSQADAEAAYCSALAQVKTAAAEVKALTPTSTVKQAQTARDDLASAVKNLQDKAKDVKNADTSAIQSAEKDIEKAVNGISGNQTLAQAAASVRAAAVPLDQALTQISNGIQCK